MRTHNARAANAVRELAVQRTVTAAARRQRDEILNGHACKLLPLDGDGLVHNNLLGHLLDDDDLGPGGRLHGCAAGAGA